MTVKDFYDKLTENYYDLDCTLSDWIPYDAIQVNKAREIIKKAYRGLCQEKKRKKAGRFLDCEKPAVSETMIS